MNTRKRIKEVYSPRLGFKVDENIEPVVHYLNKKGAKTMHSCGHQGIIRFKSKKSAQKANKLLNELKKHGYRGGHGVQDDTLKMVPKPDHPARVRGKWVGEPEATRRFEQFETKASGRVDRLAKVIRKVDR